MEHSYRTKKGSLWAATIFILGIFAAFVTPNADAAQTKIVSINSRYNINHPFEVTVYPGDVVTLMADLVESDNSGNQYGLQYDPRDFIWSSDFKSTDFCAPDWQNCVNSNFEPNQYGVNYYVPSDMTNPITVTVMNEDTGSRDQVRLVPGYTSSYGTNYPSQNDEYNGYYNDDDDFDYDHHLTPYGRWVYIGGERVFVPYSYTDGWVPYRHGNWTYNSLHGWVWNSYDPWGWVTDHYGYWRHHGSYGWVWVAFPTIQWRPAVVTFYYTDSGIGWSPYYSGYTQGYVNGYNQGYDDGYWDGFNAGLNSSYNYGHTYVYNNNFCHSNITNVFVNNVTVIQQSFSQAATVNQYGITLGSGRHITPRAFVEARGVAVTETAMRTVERRARVNGVESRVQVVRPEQRIEAPRQYRDAAVKIAQTSRGDKNTRPAPIGSRFNPRSGNVGGNSANTGRGGPVMAPRKADGSSVPAPTKRGRVEQRGGSENRGSTVPSRRKEPVPSRREEPAPTRREQPAPTRRETPAPAPQRQVPSRRDEPRSPAPQRREPSSPGRSTPTAPSRNHDNGGGSRMGGGGNSGGGSRRSTPVPNRPAPNSPAPSRPAPRGR